MYKRVDHLLQTKKKKKTVLVSKPLNDPQQCEVTMPKGDKNNNGKEETSDSNYRKESQKSQQEERKVREIIGSSREDFEEGEFIELKLRRDNRTTNIGTSPR
jgi:hypothetical protein